MFIHRFNSVVETIGLVAVIGCLADEIYHRGVIGWVLAALAYWGLHVIYDERDGLRDELGRRS